VESEFPWRTRSAMRSARQWHGSVGDEEVCREGLQWVEDGRGYFSRWPVATTVGFATAMMFWHTGIEETRWGFRSLLEVLWSHSSDR
jgi:hypothetical protein